MKALRVLSLAIIIIIVVIVHDLLGTPLATNIGLQALISAIIDDLG